MSTAPVSEVSTAPVSEVSTVPISVAPVAAPAPVNAFAVKKPAANAFAIKAPAAVNAFAVKAPKANAFAVNAPAAAPVPATAPEATQAKPFAVKPINSFAVKVGANKFSIKKP